MRRLGVRTAYGLLTASAWLPLLAAYAGDPGPAVAALVGVLGGVGTNLLSNLVQGAYDQATAPRKAEQEVAEQPDLRAEYQQVLAQLGVLAAAQDALGERWAAFATQLRQELARMGGELRIDTGGGAVVFGNVTVPYGDFVGRDKVIHIHPPAPAPDIAPLRQAYLRHLAERCGRLPLRGVDVQASDATARAERLRLAQVYVDLDTTTRRPAGRRKGDTGEALEALGGEPVSALEAVTASRHAVLLGAPGSGKSTFVGHLAFCLAMAQLEPQEGWLEHLPGWPEAEAAALPLVVVLRDFARWAVGQGLERGTARALDDFIAAWLADHALADFAGPLRQALGKGQAVVLLDGLDEVPTRELRALVRDTVEDFACTCAPSRVLVTCRTLSYQDPAWQLEAKRFPAFELAPFDEKKIDRFIGAWYGELADLGAVPAEEASPLAEKLRQAVRRPDLWRLAPNPLLLTVMALVHTYKGRLPEARALLYEECTDLLLWRWEQVKLQAERERAPGLRQLLAEAGLQDVDLKQALWALAYEAHRAAGGRDDAEAHGRHRRGQPPAGAARPPPAAQLGLGGRGGDADQGAGRAAGGTGARGLRLPAPHLPGIPGRVPPLGAGGFCQAGGAAGGSGLLAGGGAAGRGAAGARLRGPGTALDAGGRTVPGGRAGRRARLADGLAGRRGTAGSGGRAGGPLGLG
jgi:hypothetical protein